MLSSLGAQGMDVHLPRVYKDMSDERNAMVQHLLRSRPGTLPRGSAIVAVPLALASLATMAPPSIAAPSGDSGRTTTSDTERVVTRCERVVDGELLKLRLIVRYAAASGPRADDVVRIVVRATDNTERGTFRNGDVNIRGIRVAVSKPNGAISRAGSRSPFVVSTNPNSPASGKNAIYVKAVVNFKVNGTTKAGLGCLQATS